MRKRFTKIICTAVAAISALSIVGISACNNNSTVLDVKDNSSVVAETNGGFMVETQDYAYFINGVASSNDDNAFGSVLKGSVQRIKKSDVDKRDYSKTETVVPSVIYSGNHSAGLYIYDGYIYYSTPATDRNTSGAIQRNNLDFKRTKLDGSDTTRGYFFQSDNNSIDYRYVQTQAGGDVYLMYAKASEKLFGESTGVTNIHSVNCTTGVDTLIAYNVAGYAFDTEDVQNPYVYYTMNVPERLGKSGTRSYNQLFRAKADVTVSPRELDFTDVEDYDAKTNPVYVNLGDFVFDGVGSNDLDRLDQLNYTTELDSGVVKHVEGYTYAIDCYRDGKLYYTRKGNLFELKDEDYDKTEKWNAVTANETAEVFLTEPTSISSYKIVDIKGKTYAITAASDGIRKSEIKGKKIASSTTPDAESYPIDNSASATLLDIREEGEGTEKHQNLYFGVSGENGGNFIKRIALDGTFEDNYHKLDVSIDGADMTYKAVKVLDVEYDTGWYAPEFISGTNTLLFASDTQSMSSFNYIMACDLSNKEGKLMDNNELNAYTEQFEAIGKKIDEDYSSDKTYSNGTAMYENLTSALKYVFRTGDDKYMAELIKAYVDMEGRTETYKFTEDSVAKQKEFVEATGDWADYADAEKYPVKTVNGKEVRANYSDYYYTVIGRMTKSDAEALQNAFKASMPTYPEDTRSWWEKLSTGAKAGFIIGMIVLGLAVIAGATVLTIYLVRRFKNNKGVETSGKTKNVDITDDKDIDVYGDETENQ